jgi:hypothetical protein
MKDPEITLQSVLTCSEQELASLVYHSSMKVISNLLYNSNLTEDLALIIASRRNVSPEVLESLYSNERWRESYGIKLALCKNPKAPQRISLANLTEKFQIGKEMNLTLHIEPEIDDIPVLHLVGLSLQPQKAFFLCSLHAAGRDEILE